MSRLAQRLPRVIPPGQFKDQPLARLMRYARDIHLAYAAGRRNDRDRQWDEEWAKVYDRVLAKLEGGPQG